jgi:hypothetical protein
MPDPNQGRSGQRRVVDEHEDRPDFPGAATPIPAQLIVGATNAGRLSGPTAFYIWLSVQKSLASTGARYAAGVSEARL